MSRIIHTDTYTSKSLDILKALKYYMNSRWGSRQMERNASLAKVETQPNGEVTWTIDNNDWSYRRSTYADRQDDQKVREWMACALKHIVYRWFNTNGLDATKEWKRKNTRKCTAFDDKYNSVIHDFTISEIYCLFDRLLNRKTFAKQWKKTMTDIIIGEERDPVATELELARREEQKKLDDKYCHDKEAMSNAQYEAIQAARREVENQYAKKFEELKAAYLQSKKDLDESLAFAQQIDAL